MARLFVAVWPSAEALAAVAGLERPTIDGLRWTTEDQWHVTLRFLGDADMDDAVVALSTVDVARTTAVMGPVTARFGQQTLHVPVGGLDAIAAALPWPDDRPFRGHLTLARARPRRGVDLRPLCGRALAGEWPVTEIALVASELHSQGARYTVVERQPLRSD